MTGLYPIDTYAKQWDLRFLREFKEVNIETIFEGEVGVNTIFNFLEYYKLPDETQIGCFLGNTMSGNILFNFIVNELLKHSQIKSRCIRVSLSNIDYIYSAHNRFDLVLLDHVESGIDQGKMKYELIKVIDHLCRKEAGVVVLNIPRQEELHFLPDSVYDIVSVAKLNIKVKNAY